ncbi:MAG TPA: two-component system response regulator [Cyanobacteria bacterium UBA11049]|jgi:DNA-binding response OmpR family regulator|nr:two-component system response regulator [Cyanobacteria bacterium UBA11049]
MSTVLVIDDSATERQVITSCLQRGGLTVETATSSEEAFAKISSQKPDAIVLDVVLPGRSGFELCRDLKAEAGTSKIPVVLCSTKSSEMDKFWGMKQGADAYITKPIDQETLLQTIKQLIKS